MRKFPDQPASGAIVPPMVYVTEKTVWEHTQILRHLAKDNIPTEEELNRLGKDGWELVSTLNYSEFVYLFFKRIKG